MRFLLVLAALLLHGCGDDRPPAPTAAENEQLNEAGAMLDELTNEEGATPEDAAPPETVNGVR